LKDSCFVHKQMRGSFDKTEITDLTTTGIAQDVGIRPGARHQSLT